MNTIFQVNDYYKLLSLHRALMEAKFAEQPNDPDISGSRFVAEMADQVIEMLITMEKERGHSEKAARWSEWRKISESRREWQIALDRLRTCRSWEKWSVIEKTDYAKILFSPLTVDDELLKVFIRKGDSMLVSN